jgi:predicted amidohydrolase
VGDFAGNLEQIKSEALKASESGIDLVIFGELALCGYPLGDLSYRRDLVSASETALNELVRFSSTVLNVTLLVGLLTNC